MAYEDLDSEFPWARKCLEVLQSVLPTPFEGRHLMFGSDYSGGHRKSDYRVYAFIVVDGDNSDAYPIARSAVRQQYFPDARRMSYKRMNDGVRQRALIPFLNAADTCAGMCCVFVVHKSLERMSTTSRSLSMWQESVGTQGRWGQSAFETMARISHFFSLLLSVASKAHQHITWITDQDEIAANDDRNL